MSVASNGHLPDPEDSAGMKEEIPPALDPANALQSPKDLLPAGAIQAIQIGFQEKV